MIEFLNVTKRFPNGSVALSDVSLRIGKGEFVFVVGPSGAGKTTLVKLIYREETPTSGDVLVGGRSVVSLRPWAVPYLRRRIGVVFQDFRLLPNRTVFENVAFAMRVIEAPARQIAREVPKALELVGLAGKAQSYPSELSGGEQQRIALARAMVNNPAVLLADEPTGNLDPETAWGIMTLFEEINRRGTTVVIATHARTIVNAMHKRVVALEAGRVVRDETEGAYDRAL